MDANIVIAIFTTVMAIAACASAFYAFCANRKSDEANANSSSENTLAGEANDNSAKANTLADQALKIAKEILSSLSTTASAMP